MPTDDLTRQRIQLAIAIVLVSIVVAIPTWHVIEVGITPNTDVYTNQEFLDNERELLGPLYPMYYECDFYNSSSVWYKPEYFQYGNYGEDM